MSDFPRTHLARVGLVFAAAALFACGDEPAVRVYEAPRPQPVAASPAAGDAAPSSEIVPTVDTPEVAADAPSVSGEDHGRPGVGEAFAIGPIAGRLPANWRPAPAEPPRVAAFTVAGEGYTAEVAVTRFGPWDRMGGLLANVNRWRRQLGEGPIASADGVERVPFRFGPVQALLLPMVQSEPTADSRAFLIAVIPLPETTWFVKMDGPTRMIDAEIAGMLAFLNHLQIEGVAAEDARRERPGARPGARP